MLLHELKINLIEVLNTKVNVQWRETSMGCVGSLLIGDQEYQIHLDEYQLTLLSGTYSLIDFGFTKGADVWAYQFDSANASSVLGAVLNGFSEKIKTLKPDAILFGVNNKNGAIESRMRMYDRLSRLYSKGSSYSFLSDWLKTVNGQYKILSQTKFSDEDMKIILDTAANIETKN